MLNGSNLLPRREEQRGRAKNINYRKFKRNLYFISLPKFTFLFACGSTHLALPCFSKLAYQIKAAYINVGRPGKPSLFRLFIHSAHHPTALHSKQNGLVKTQSKQSLLLISERSSPFIFQPAEKALVQNVSNNVNKRDK